MFEALTTPVLKEAQWKERLHGPAPKPNNLYFTPDWKQGKMDWVADNYWQIVQTVIVPYKHGYTLPGNDYINVDLANDNAGLQIYPNTTGIIYETLIGMGKGNYQVGFYFPGITNYILNLGYPYMVPNIADINNTTANGDNHALAYLGVFQPEDSPFDNPLLKIWTLYQMPSYFLQTFVQPGVDFDKPIFNFIIAKHRVAQITKPDVFDTIIYPTIEAKQY